jgi:hypothetical protein
MDEVTRERNAGFARVQQHLGEVAQELAAYVKDRVS